MTGIQQPTDANALVWGREVRRAREELGLSLRELSRVLRVSHRTIHRWEHNENTPPAAILQRLANLSGLTLGLQFTPEEPRETD